MDWQPVVPIIMSLVGQGFAIKGWLYANSRANKREDRKEARSFADRIIKDLEVLEVEALKYHTDSASSSGANLIKAKLKEIGGRIDLFKGMCRSDLDFAADVVRLRQSMTLKNFDTSTWEKLSPSSPIVLGFVDQRVNLSLKIDRAFVAGFPRQAQ
jgi:hypothetical protein